MGSPAKLQKYIIRSHDPPSLLIGGWLSASIIHNEIPRFHEYFNYLVEPQIFVLSCDVHSNVDTDTLSFELKYLFSSSSTKIFQVIIYLKTRMSTNNLSMKILIQSLSRLLPSNILEELLKEDASNYCSEINRRKGAGSL